ncbi:hypothetical protein [Geodermatophilus sp. DSM 45219]|uniref:hypothetical protein n=1 Tax=Geodermatophilus sp. DSM 45219 TaxID=1881103 RepID=UPI001C40A39F|nr:hypothetical protein [Geodermatophilus sp. DSM 45219]
MGNKRPWFLRGWIGRQVGRYLTRHGLDVTQTLYMADTNIPLARVRIKPGEEVRASDIVDVRTFVGQAQASMRRR